MLFFCFLKEIQTNKKRINTKCFYLLPQRTFPRSSSTVFNRILFHGKKVCIVYHMFSLVLSMICKTRGSTHFGSFWSASFNGTSSPVSRFFTITHSSISCIVNGVNYLKGTIIIIVILKLPRQSIGRLYPSRCFF